MKSNRLLIALSFITLLSSISSLGQVYPKREFRGVWICSAYNLDWPSSSKLSVKQQQDEFIQIIEQHKSNGLNAVIVQIRASSDAFYRSDIEPWSYWLTGTQGKAPEPLYDPLEFMIQECHKRNIEFHAWFNLFRGVSNTKFFPPSATHPYTKHPEWFYTLNESKLYNPGIPEVRNYLTSIISDVTRRYDVDGIHLDDYFYPHQYANNKTFDLNTYKTYADSSISIEDWRRNNINTIIHQIHDSIKSIKRHVKFGISPSGIWRHKHQDTCGSVTDRSMTSYDELYADSRKWLQEGWVDYLAPQVYYSTKHKNANFNTIVHWWAQQTPHRHVYIGHACFRIGESKSLDWQRPEELPKQLRTVRNTKNIQGSILYRSANFKSHLKGLKDSLMHHLYKAPALIPKMNWIDSIPPLGPKNLIYHQRDSATSYLTWDGPQPASDGDTATYYIVYAFSQHDDIHNLKDPRHIVEITRKNTYEIPISKKGTTFYYVTAVDRLHNESTFFVALWVE